MNFDYDDIINNMFLRSALTEQNPFNSTDEVLRWMRKQNSEIKVSVEPTSFSQMNEWFFDAGGNLRHKSGKFFSIEGLSVKTNFGKVTEWQQPIINQPEVGYLGIITKEFDGVLFFLLQAKVEPGNINNVQLSPTLQATKSNYSQVHGGHKPAYLEYFQNATKEQIILDQLQSEQGARFLKKRNRNIIIIVEDDIPIQSNFIWLTLAQIKKLTSFDNVINMDTRTVISGIPLFITDKDIDLVPDSLGVNLISAGKAKHSLTYILSWMTALKCKFELETRSIDLFDVKDWKVTDYSIHHKNDKFFKVIATNVSINNREVKSWMQPLVQPMCQGLTAFVVKKINNTYHFLVQGKVEAGNFDVLEMAPTVQCITDVFSSKGENLQQFVKYVLTAKKEQILYDTMQSEEGGRFYQEQNRNVIIEADDDFPEDTLPENYIWITHQQLLFFLRLNNFLNIQARSLLSLISLI